MTGMAKNSFEEGDPNHAGPHGGYAWEQSEEAGAVGEKFCRIKRVGCPWFLCDDIMGLLNNSMD